MSVVGQNPNLPHCNTDARFTSISRPQQGGFNATLCANSGLMQCSKDHSLDHLVRERKKLIRHGEAKRYGVGAPRNTPAEIVDKLNKEINAGLADPRMEARLADLGGTALRGSPADFAKLIVEETQKWAKVVKFSGAKPE
jgi:Tripartite tricarboxylate transporter family receptor